MQFSSVEFIFVFLPIVLFLCLLINQVRTRLILLTIAGYVFYGYNDWRYCALLAGVSVAGFSFALWIEDSHGELKKRMITTAGVSFFVGTLVFFKYLNFVTESLNTVFGATLMPALAVSLPIGISFYTFNSISYILDVRAERTKASKSLIEYFSYIALFPQLISGPLLRFGEIAPELRALGVRVNGERFIRACWIFAIGLVKKVVIADTLGTYVNPMVADVATLSTLAAWQAALAYTFQLYYDFSGYSDMAVGLGLLFGLTLPWNFDSPYRSMGIRDFWRRWHISLSRWLRDYLFLAISYPLSRRTGDFKLLGFRQDYWLYAIAAIFTMTLAGLWHGARWTFVIWGCYHGILLAIDQFSSRKFKRLPKSIYSLATFLLVLFGWVIFRSPDLTTAGVWIHRMLYPSCIVSHWSIGLTILLGFCTYAVIFIPEVKDINLRISTRSAILMGFLFFMSILFMNGHDSVFLYYQF